MSGDCLSTALRIESDIDKGRTPFKKTELCNGGLCVRIKATDRDLVNMKESEDENSCIAV